MANLATTKLSIMLFTLFSILFMSSYATGPDPVLHSEKEHSFYHTHDIRKVSSGPNSIHNRLVAPIYSNSAGVSSNIKRAFLGGPDPIHNPPKGYNSFSMSVKREVPGGPNPIHNPPIVRSTDSNSGRGSSTKTASPGGPDPVHNPPKGFSTLDMSIKGEIPSEPSLIHNPPVVSSTNMNSGRGLSIKRATPGGPNPIHNPPKGFNTLDMSINGEIPRRPSPSIKREVPGGPDPIHNPKAYILD